jgi:hypothetical protein
MHVCQPASLFKSCIGTLLPIYLLTNVIVLVIVYCLLCSILQHLETSKVDLRKADGHIRFQHTFCDFDRRARLEDAFPLLLNQYTSLFNRDTCCHVCWSLN